MKTPYAMMILIDNYDSFTYNLYHYFIELGQNIKLYKNDEDIASDQLEAATAFILSPGPSTPDQSGSCIDIIARYQGIKPIFGVCLGHQAIAQVMGAKIIKAPKAVHGKTSNIHHTQQGLFKDIPTPFIATRYHSLMIDQTTLPRSITVSAKTNDGLIMAIENAKLGLYGVQFHPESITSQHGHHLLRNFIDIAENWPPSLD